jgi:uncharacterized protein YebE (UPF0316 family)
MDVQIDIGHVVNVFAGNKPDDLVWRLRILTFGHTHWLAAGSEGNVQRLPA